MKINVATGARVTDYYPPNTRIVTDQILVMERTVQTIHDFETVMANSIDAPVANGAVYRLEILTGRPMYQQPYLYIKCIDDRYLIGFSTEQIHS